MPCPTGGRMIKAFRKLLACGWYTPSARIILEEANESLSSYLIFIVLISFIREQLETGQDATSHCSTQWMWTVSSTFTRTSAPKDCKFSYTSKFKHTCPMSYLVVLQSKSTLIEALVELSHGRVEKNPAAFQLDYSFTLIEAVSLSC